MHLLLLEDDLRVASFLRRGLQEEGHTVDVAPTLHEARALLASGVHDLLLLDRMVPDGDGLDLVRRLRAAGDERPVLVLTARDRVDDRVEGLYGGADDYLTKPFSFEELLARLAALGRRARTEEASATVQIGDLVVDPSADRAWIAAGAEPRELSLTAQEHRLLRFLVSHRGRVLSRARLLDGVWGLQHDPGSNVVDVYVRYLRNKLAEAGAAPLIHTVRGRGYVLEDRGP
jgi:two-component system OmpR family response regulator